MSDKIGLFLAIGLVFALVAVFGAFALVMLAQSTVMVMQSVTMFQMQCSSILVVLSIVVETGFLIWRRQERRSIGPNRTTYVLTAPARQGQPQAAELASHQSFPELFADTNADDLSQLLSESEGSPAVPSTPWVGKSPWEGS